MIRKNDIFEAEITAMTAEGSGICRAEGMAGKQVSDLGPVSCVQSLLSYFHQQFLESWQESSLQSDVSLEKRQHFSIHQEQLLRFRI